MSLGRHQVWKRRRRGDVFARGAKEEPEEMKISRPSVNVDPLKFTAAVGRK